MLTREGRATLLAAYALQEAHAAGYIACLTDWRTSNLQAARLWPHLGFRPFQYRLHRLIDERIAWAPSFPHEPLVALAANTRGCGSVRPCSRQRPTRSASTL